MFNGIKGDKETSKDYVFVNPKVIYVLLAEDNTVKVGITSNFAKRLSSIQSGSGKRIIEYYFTDFCSNAIEIETQIKSHFKEEKLLGEWFKCSYQKMVGYLKDLFKKSSKQEIITYEENEKRLNSFFENIKSILFTTKNDIADDEFFKAAKVIFFYLFSYVKKLEENEYLSRSSEVLNSIEIIKEELLSIPEYFTNEQKEYLEHIEGEYEKIYQGDRQ